VWPFATTLERTARWYRSSLTEAGEARALTHADLTAYAEAARAADVAWAR
jgi:hypothetical protein